MKTKIPYHVICKVKSGDEEAIRFILQYLEPMIVDASKRMVRTDKDTIKEVVDDDIRAFIESELILAIIHKYDLSRVPNDQSPT